MAAAPRLSRLVFIRRALVWALLGALAGGVAVMLAAVLIPASALAVGIAPSAVRRLAVVIMLVGFPFGLLTGAVAAVRAWGAGRADAHASPKGMVHRGAILGAGFLVGTAVFVLTAGLLASLYTLVGDLPSTPAEVQIVTLVVMIAVQVRVGVAAATGVVDRLTALSCDLPA